MHVALETLYEKSKPISETGFAKNATGALEIN